MDKKFCQGGIEEIFDLLETSVDGLSSKKIEEKEKTESNVFAVKKISLLKIFFKQYQNFLILLLAIGAVTSILLGQFTDGLIIFAILILNGILGAYQEYKAEKLNTALNAHIPQKVSVRRQGKEIMIDRKDLVSGDIVILSSGQIAPADIRLIKNFGLMVDESALTGESVGIAKQVKELDIVPKSLIEMVNIVFAGTIISQGQGEGVVIATGERTEFGKIISFTGSAKKRSSFLNQINSLSDFLFKATLLVAGLLFIMLIVFKSELGINNIFLFVIAISIAIVPEMLPLISIIALTKTSIKLVKKGVLVKRLSSLEDLGGIEVICTDKTGTITENVLKIFEIISKKKDDCLKYALMASQNTTDSDHILAGSFDSAIWEQADENLKKLVTESKRIWQNSFDPVFRWQFSVYSDGAVAEVVIKGSPESIIARCKLNAEEKEKFLLQAKEFGSRGFRVLAVAKGNIEMQEKYNERSISDLDFLGFINFNDPIKSTTAKALRLAKELGLQIKILTGDTLEVAKQVSKKIGMKINDDEIVTGEELSKIAEIDKKMEVILKAKIFARVNPKEKYEIVQILAKKYSVMFLGEGINDAPALKQADVGMVVQEASDIAKEAADIVLTKPDLYVIIESINYGRQIMSNIGNYILITLAGNFGSLYSISLVSIIFPILPLLPIQILFENLVTDVPMISMVNESVGQKVKRVPMKQNIRQIAFHSTILGGVILLIQFVFFQLFSDLPPDIFRTLWLTEIVLFEFSLIISLRTTEWFWKAPRLSFATLGLFVLVIAGMLFLPFISPLNDWFHLQAYEPIYILYILGIVIAGLFITELVKKMLFARTRNNSL